MKRILTIILALTLVISCAITMFSCGKKEEGSSDNGGGNDQAANASTYSKGSFNFKYPEGFTIITETEDAVMLMDMNTKSSILNGKHR